MPTFAKTKKSLLPKNQTEDSGSDHEESSHNTDKKIKKAKLREITIKPAMNGFVITSRKEEDGEHFTEPTQYVEKDIEGALKQVQAILEE